jgi:site-specific DNA-methyltransferase (adenine-specific)
MLPEDRVCLFTGDCLESLKQFPDNYVDAIVTDPPYGLTQGKRGGTGVKSINTRSPAGRSRIGTGVGPGGFMGMAWDAGVPGPDYWQEMLRVAKPGACLLACGGPRTYHRLACAIEDAGWEVKDCILWVFGQGFPKSLDIARSVEGCLVGNSRYSGRQLASDDGPAPPGKQWQDSSRRTMADKSDSGWSGRRVRVSRPEAKQWVGYGTALKPAYEPILLAMKACEGTYAQNALKWGVAGLWIDGCRISVREGVDDPRLGGKGTWATDRMAKTAYGEFAGSRVGSSPSGRWPANVVHDGSADVVSLFPSGASGKPGVRRKPHETHSMAGRLNCTGEVETGYGDEGSAARFFYCAKVSAAERGEGNDHPTVKPLSLMRYLCRLVRMPSQGVILDPFMGSGSTGIAALLEGFRFVGIDSNVEYVGIAERRIERALSEVRG